MPKFLHLQHFYSTIETVNFNISHVLMNSVLKRVISFSWSPLNVTGCVLVPNHFTILSSSCGICPNITNQTSVNCTDVPTNAERCLFVIIPNICGGPSYHSSTFVNIDFNHKQGSYCINFFLCI